MAIVKLRNIRIIFPRIWNANENGKYTCGLLIEKDSQAYKDLMKGLQEAWAAGRAKHGATSFCENPRLEQLFNRAFIKQDGGLDCHGNPVPDYYAGCIGFTANSREPVPMIDVTGARVNDNDTRVYDGQNAHVSLDIVAVKGQNTPCVGRYLRSIMLLSGGERINTGFNGGDPAADFASDIDPKANPFTDFNTDLPF